eukprot:TRINITY_DN1831_c0_g3_i1.p1 TRINITY_DN1831_c0_g3~~TRINITY_DN1831_c0_g3_i1.p1  ORF type:complete len:511 (-),score=88.35 TRINITY_DN1831_c0_g3_i1:222-1712(-)
MPMQTPLRAAPRPPQGCGARRCPPALSTLFLGLAVSALCSCAEADAPTVNKARKISVARHNSAGAGQSGATVPLAKSSVNTGDASAPTSRVLLGHTRRLQAGRQTSAGVVAAAATANASALKAVQSSILKAVAETAAAANVTANATANASHWPSSGTPLDGRPPRIHFLFLAVDKVSNLGLWRKFFAQAPREQYRAYVHCKLPSCSVQVAGTELVAVPTVPSYYCTDLVSPMNQLLSVALGSEVGPTNQMDKFVFISDSTLPAKPFSYMYTTLANRQGSDFCVFPSGEWADVAAPAGGGVELAVKHHQWVTLSRPHAEKASSLWAGGQLHDFMQRYQMNANPFSMADNAFADHRNFGCLDEFWYMAALYGPLHHTGSFHSEQLPMFSGPPLLVTAATSWQGTCDTFVMWSQYVPSKAGGTNSFDRFYATLDLASTPHSGNQARPGWWDKMSSHGISSIRNSEFLFMRKFTDNPYLTDAPYGGGGFAEAYERLVFNM